MFQITVASCVKLHSNLISIGGPCSNLQQFSSPITDENGERYDAHIPLGKTLVIDDSRVILGIYGNYEVEKFMGQTLRSAE